MARTRETEPLLPDSPASSNYQSTEIPSTSASTNPPTTISSSNNRKPNPSCVWSKILLIAAIVLGLTLATVYFCMHINTTPIIPDDDNQNCSVRLVETIPIGLTYPANSPRFNSTYDAWRELLNSANSTIDLGTFYWTMRGQDFYNHSSAAYGEDIYNSLVAIGLQKKVKIRIAQSQPTEKEPNLDTIDLDRMGLAEIRSVDFARRLGGGVLHTKLWVVDNKHFYVGSANMDWRSLSQVKELGVVGTNCPTMAKDLQKIFAAYWYLGDQSVDIPAKWPASYATTYNASKMIDFGQAHLTYFSSSPPPLRPQGRADDLQTILSIIGEARSYVYISVMDYIPMTVYTEPRRYWPYIDDALRSKAMEGVSIKLLISWWKHSDPSMDYFLRSLQSLNGVTRHVSVEVRRFVVPADSDQAKIPFSRVNHNKYMVTDQTAYIGTSNWSGDYFTDTAGIGMVLKDKKNVWGITESSMRSQVENIFLRDWFSPYAKEFK